MENRIEVKFSPRIRFAKTEIEIAPQKIGDSPVSGRLYLSGPIISAFVHDISPAQLRELAEICNRVADYCDKKNAE